MVKKLELVKDEQDSPEKVKGVTNVVVKGIDNKDTIGDFKNVMGYQFGPSFVIISLAGGKDNRVFPFANFSELIVTTE